MRYKIIIGSIFFFLTTFSIYAVILDTSSFFDISEYTDTTCQGSICKMRIYAGQQYINHSGSWDTMPGFPDTVFPPSDIPTSTETGLNFFDFFPETYADTASTSVNTGDNYLKASQATSNFGSATNLDLQNNANMHIILSFAVPTTTGTITSARVVLTNVGNFGLWVAEKATIHTQTRTDWSESQSTWNIYKTANNWTTAGGDYDATIIDEVTPVDTNFAQTSWDVMGAGADHPLTILQNTTYNFLIKVKNEASAQNFIRFASKENATASYRPFFEITYVVSGGGGSTSTGILTENENLSILVIIGILIGSIMFIDLLRRIFAGKFN